MEIHVYIINGVNKLVMLQCIIKIHVFTILNDKGSETCVYIYFNKIHKHTEFTVTNLPVNVIFNVYLQNLKV